MLLLESFIDTLFNWFNDLSPIYTPMKFEELSVRELSSNLYEKINKIYNKQSCKDYFFRDQILRATLSISNNIAEWFERETNNELRRFLYIAKGSCWEVRSMLKISIKTGKITQEIFDDLHPICTHISVMLYTYIQTLT